MLPIIIAVAGFVITQAHNQLSARKGAQSARSIGVYFKNLTNRTIYLKSSSLDHGIWTASGPVPQSIGPNQVGAWMCESNGFSEFRSTPLMWSPFAIFIIYSALQ
jgi:hypothetical protein